VITMGANTKSAGSRVRASASPPSAGHHDSSGRISIHGALERADILFQNVDGTPLVWTMNGTSVTATATLPNPGILLHANTG
jgi:hypothetical protein